ncbi:MAG TPA: alpha-galactosidase [Thermotogota bacterium]|nr:alpha-galactosidase [Thermotogota bacterium]HRW34672.1 alpha-galactosidase [Thermotogota bacterium]
MAVKYDETKKIWVLETQNTAYSFGLHASGKIKHTYWGKKILRFEDYPAFEGYFESPWWDWNDEYPVRGAANQTEPCLQVMYEDEVRDVQLTYKDFETTKDSLTIHLEDEYYQLLVRLQYQLYEEEDLITKYVTLENRSHSDISIENFKTGSFYLPPTEDYLLTHLTGMWAHESRVVKEPIYEGKKVFESRVGRTSHFHNPFFAIDEKATEDTGNVWFGLLAWSGNWKTVIHKLPYENIQICTGLNDWDFNHALKQGETISSPRVLYGFTNGGFGDMSRKLHNHEINRVLPKENAQKVRKVLYNSWEATAFNVTEANQRILADQAADIGVEIFVVDDGWFGRRFSDKAGLGDWVVNEEKFPNGLESLIEYVNSKGMDFGLWVEPEMVNPDSDLYRNHPDWVLHFPNRPQTESRNQLILNLARDDVKEFVFNTVDGLLEHYNIQFVKWDMNRPIFEAGWPFEGNQRKMWMNYVTNLYEIWKRLKVKHPQVIMESCAGGGGRIDLGIMRYADQFWTSDNTDPLDRQLIQEGFSLCYAPKTMMGWVTDWGGKETYSLAYRFHTAMMGSLGIGSDLSKYTAEEIDETKEWIAFYKKIRETVQHGSLYRLISPREKTFTANQYISIDKNEVVLFCMKNPTPLSMFKVLRVRLKGLDENAHYEIQGEDKVLSGSYLMNRGLDVDFVQKHTVKVEKGNHFDSQVLVLKKKN